MNLQDNNINLSSKKNIFQVKNFGNKETKNIKVSSEVFRKELFHNINEQNFLKRNKFEFYASLDSFLKNVNKLKSSMTNLKMKNPKNEINKFKRSLFTDYSNNSNFILEKKETPIFYEKDDSSTSSQTKNSILGFKTNRNEKSENKDKKENIIQKKLIEENKPIVSFNNGIIRIKNDEIDDSIQNKNNLEINQNNRNNLHLIKKLLIDCNYEINKQSSKTHKKYIFIISDIYFKITINKENYKIVEIYEKKGENEKAFDKDLLIHKELIHIKNYLEKKKKT